MLDSSTLELETEKVMVWRGDPDDWNRCHHLMMRLNRDGTKLELWREWLGVSPRTRQRKVWTEDDYSVPSEKFNGAPSVRAPSLGGAQRESLAAVVHDHVWGIILPSVYCKANGPQVEELIRLFIYPESRAEFFRILSTAGITFDRDYQLPTEALGVEFWSYT